MNSQAERNNQSLHQQLAQIDSLLLKAENLTDPAALGLTREIVRILMEFHGAGLQRILEQLAARSEGQQVIDSLAEDELIASLFLLYGLHPLDLGTRVRQALDKVRPYLHSHGGNVELLGIAEGVVRLRLQGSCHGCPSSALTLKQTIEEAIHENAPDATAIEVEGETSESRSPAEHASGVKGRFGLPILAG